MRINFTDFNIQNYIGKNFLDYLTSTQKKTIAIAFAIFSCVALGYYSYRFCRFKASLETEDAETRKDTSKCLVSELNDGRIKKVFFQWND